jgi:hypothetical protein
MEAVFFLLERRILSILPPIQTGNSLAGFGNQSLKSVDSEGKR